MKNLLSYISRQAFIIPGGYYLYKLFSYIFPPPQKSEIKIIETPYKFKIKVDISRYLGNKIYWRGAHDWNTIFALQKTLSPDSILFDIGANIGEYTLFAASMINDNGHIYSFEPVQKMYEQLQENISLNPHLKNKITPIKKGIGLRKEKLPIYDDVNTTNDGLFSLHQKNFIEAKIIEEIEIDSLDNIFNTLNINIVHYIKIDVEGNELFVLQGGINTIKKFKTTLMIEISEKNFNAAGYSSKDLLSLLKELDYSIYLIQKRGKLKPINNDSDLPAFCNIIAMPKKYNN
jgi:FkbM family methyltransferase